MRVLLANDTSRVNHAGCKAVVEVLKQRYDVTYSHYWNDRMVPNLSECDCVVVNGEGTMHDDAPGAVWLLDLLLQAQQAGKRTELVNSVWQNMSHHPALDGLDDFTVREPLSAEASGARLVLDASLSASVARGVAKKGYEGRVVVGDSWAEPEIGDLLLSNISWADLVATLRTVRRFVTGRFHGVCAALRAGCEFEVKGGANTHKIKGMMMLLGRS